MFSLLSNRLQSMAVADWWSGKTMKLDSNPSKSPVWSNLLSGTINFNRPLICSGAVLLGQVGLHLATQHQVRGQLRRLRS